MIKFVELIIFLSIFLPLVSCEQNKEIPIGYRIILFENTQQRVEAKVFKVTQKLCPQENKTQIMLFNNAVTEFYIENRRVIMDIMVMDTTSQVGVVNIVNNDKSYAVNIVI